MVAIGHGWKELEIPLGQYHQHTMLVGSRDQKVDIARTINQYLTDAPAALPIAVGHALPMKLVKDLHQPKRHRIFSR
jgi:hypothetical protein